MVEGAGFGERRGGVMTFVCKADFLVGQEHADFIERRALAGSGIDASYFRQGAGREAERTHAGSHEKSGLGEALNGEKSL